MNNVLATIKPGLLMTLLGLLFGIGMGILFGINEDMFKDFVAQGVAANPTVHDASSADKIWRYAQRAHFHGTGIAAFSLGLLFLVTLSSLSHQLKRISSILIGLGSFYPLAWLTMYFVAPAIGRDPAHAYWLTEVLTYIGVGGLSAGLFIVCTNLFFGLFKA